MGQFVLARSDVQFQNRSTRVFKFIPISSRLVLVLIHTSTLLFMIVCGKCCVISYAQNLFDELPQRNVQNRGLYIYINEYATMPQSDAQKSQNSKGDTFSSKDDGNQHNKKSVLAKVKEKAKKLRFSLSRKKRQDENELRSHSAPPPVGASSEDKAEHVEFHDARTSESARAPAPETGKQAHLQEPSISTPENHPTTSHYEPVKLEPMSPRHTKPHPQPKNDAPFPDPPVSTLEPKTHEPPSDDLPESTNGSRFSGLTISTHEKGPNKTNEPVEGSENMKGESQTWDKGVSVKEYLMHKFEPGEDERALSQVITQTISPRRDKMRDAMNSFLKNDEPTEPTDPTGANSSIPPTNLNPDLKSKSVRASMSLNPDTDTNTDTDTKVASMNPSHSFGSSGADASLNETFKSTVASYQSQSSGSGSNPDTGLNPTTSSSSPNVNLDSDQSSTKTSSSPSAQVHVSSPNQTQVPCHTESINVTGSPGSTANQTQSPIIAEANATRSPGSTANQIQSPGHIDANAAQSPGLTANQPQSPGHTDAYAAQPPGSTANQTQSLVYANVNPTNSHEVVEVEKLQKDSPS